MHTSINAVDELGEILHFEFKDFDLHRTKCTAIITNVIFPYFTESMDKQLKGSSCCPREDKKEFILVKCACHSLDLVALKSTEAIPSAVEHSVRETYSYFSHGSFRQEKYTVSANRVCSSVPPLLPADAQGSSWAPRVAHRHSLPEVPTNVPSPRFELLRHIARPLAVTCLWRISGFIDPPQTAITVLHSSMPQLRVDCQLRYAEEWPSDEVQATVMGVEACHSTPPATFECTAGSSRFGSCDGCARACPWRVVLSGVAAGGGWSQRVFP
ncbi:hypothetical protein HPB49_005915 [Dermacentor silvarum]|uniref:Uncharacterized protein n=1 Tax=Dermacentor silvarum TaxID=543639 RepID=A0ACB8DW24_DERSI|nr:hypothetical protein HPB49_005915 [Dermacentor silvarum]